LNFEGAYSEATRDHGLAGQGNEASEEVEGDNNLDDALRGKKHD
jgi:hypothetical protein